MNKTIKLLSNLESKKVLFSPQLESYSIQEIEELKNSKKAPSEYFELLEKYGSIALYGAKDHIVFYSIKEMLTSISNTILPGELRSVFIFACDESGSQFFFDTENICGKGPSALFRWQMGSNFNEVEYLGSDLFEVICKIINGG